MNENMKKGYIIFNADGTEPKSTLATFENDNGVQVVLHGTSGNLLMLYGSIVQALHENGIDKQMLHETLDEAIKLGDSWLGFMKLAEETAEKLHNKGISGKILEKLRKALSDEDTDEDVEEINLEELFRSED